MDKWKNNNLSSIQEYPFDFERYIAEQLREIADPEEQVFAKKVLLQGMGNAIREMEGKYRTLESRIYEELELTGSQYEIVTTIIQNKDYDKTNQTLYPVREEDLQEKELKEAVSTQKEVFLGSVFLRITEPDLIHWKQKRRLFATWKTEGEKRQVTVCIRPATRYRKEIERLYQIFQDNMIPWETVHVGYLERFFDIYVDRDFLPTEKTITLSQLDISWEEAAGAVEYGMMPLWNIEHIRLDSEKFREATIDGIYYEHEIQIKNRVQTDGYLIEKNADILDIRQEKDKIIIKSRKEEYHSWDLLHLVQAEPVRSLDYREEFLTNHKRDTFLGRISAYTGNRLLTKADVFRRIMDLDIRKFVKIAGYEICEQTSEIPQIEGMNWFLEQELIPTAHRRILLLQFEALQPEHYLTDSMINFAVSQMQMEFIEYRLAGVRI